MAVETCQRCGTELRNDTAGGLCPRCLAQAGIDLSVDGFALEATGNGPAYASALTRLANQNLADVDPEPWVEMLLYSHPALSRRIAMAEAYPPAAPK